MAFQKMVKHSAMQPYLTRILLVISITCLFAPSAWALTAGTSYRVVVVETGTEDHTDPPAVAPICFPDQALTANSGKQLSFQSEFVVEQVLGAVASNPIVRIGVTQVAGQTNLISYFSNPRSLPRFRVNVTATPTRYICYIRYQELVGMAEAIAPAATTPAENNENEESDFISTALGNNVQKMNALDPASQQCTQIPARRDPSVLCDFTRPTVPAARRALYLQYIVEAANTHNVHPALIMASIAVETSFAGALLENESEKRAYLAGGGHRSYRWGKGIGQFGASNAADFNLNWYAPEPANEQAAWAATYNQAPAAGTAWSIWSPRGSILAKAIYLRRFLNRQFTDHVRASDGTATEDTYRVDHLYRFEPARKFRYVVGMYNRGLMPVNSLKEGYRQNSLVPRDYLQAWNVPRLEQTPASSILHREYINRCHVAKVNGVCGRQNMNHIAHYETLFVFDRGSWRVRE